MCIMYVDRWIDTYRDGKIDRQYFFFKCQQLPVFGTMFLVN